MSVNNEQPLSRRAAREAAERAAREAAQGSLPAPEWVSPTPSASAPPTSAPRAEPEQRMRRRDFRPPAEQPSRRASFSTTLDEDAPLDYRTEHPATPPPSHHGADLPPGGRQRSDPHVIGERTLSRRELRTLREAQEHGTVPPGENLVPPAEAPTPPQYSAPETHTLPSPAPLPSSAPAPPPLIEPRAGGEERSTAPPSSAPTGGHWSVGAHDDEDPFANTFSREVGAASSSTNALVLPQMPESTLSGPVGVTGEIIVTGMIEVPRIMTSTGTVPSIHDRPDIDDYLEPGDVELTSTNSAPVSALRAVSGHTGSNSMMNGKPPRSGNTLTTVLVASTVVMAVVAIGLFVLAAVNGLF